MATFTVTTAADVVDVQDGKLSLREAVSAANAKADADSIRFAGSLEGKKLVLTGGELKVTHDVAIDGDRNRDRTGVTIDGNEKSRVFNIGGNGTEAELTGLTLTGGSDLKGGDGGAVYLGRGDGLSVSRSVLKDNTAGNYYAGFGTGGAVFAAKNSRLTIADSQLSGNYGRKGGAIEAGEGTRLRIEASTLRANVGYVARLGQGGALDIDGGEATIGRSTIADNQASGNGGGIYAQRSRVTLTNSTVSSNFGNYRFGYGAGGGIFARDGSTVTLRSSTITGNSENTDPQSAGNGIFISAADAYTAKSRLRIADSIVAGNYQRDTFGNGTKLGPVDDIAGTVTTSNGHNVFGSKVAGANDGDVQGIAARRVFAALDPVTNGGRLGANLGPTPTVALRDAVDQPRPQRCRSRHQPGPGPARRQAPAAGRDQPRRRRL